MSKKEKLLAAAQKNLLKGQLAKAIKDYEKVIEDSPNDVRNRQKLGELYYRAGMMAEALETYESVARHYAKNGFYLKAIAVYKQMQKVDSSQIQVYYKLAELNEKQGLLGNAQAEYRQLVKLLRNQDKEKEVTKVLEKMKDLEPDNIQLHMELVDAYARQQAKEQAAEAFGEALEHLQERKDLGCPASLRQALEKYCPGNGKLKIALARVLLDRRDAASSIGLLKEELAGNPENRNAVLLLADGYHLSGDYRQEQKLCQQFLRKNPPDLDVREKSVRAHLACGDGRLAFDELETWKEAFFGDQRLPVLKDFYEQLKVLFPGNDAVQKSLRTVYEKTGEGGKLFDLMSSGEQEAGIGSFESEAESGEAGQASAAYGELPEELEVEFPADPPTPEAPAATKKAETVESAPIPEETSQEDDDNLEFEIELEINEPDLSPETFETSHLDFDNLDLEEPAEETSIDVDEIIGGLGDLDIGKTEPVAPVDVTGELEEAEFYLQQGLVKEAQAKCQALLKAAPDCEEARMLLDRILGRPQAAPPEPAKPSKGKAKQEAVQDREKSRLDGSLNEFKKGLENQIGAEDTETHYNLGIAYKEMGLLDEAVEQFEKAMLDPSRRVDCLTLKGICQVQKGDFGKAVGTFKFGLALSDLKDEERISFHYELGVLYQAWQRPQEALESYQRVAEAEPFFRDVETKIKALRKELGTDDNGGSDSGNSSSKDRISYI